MGRAVAEVEVDTETGEVRVVRMVSVNDCGFPVNPLTTESQVLGAMIQGVVLTLPEASLTQRVQVRLCHCGGGGGGVSVGTTE